MPAPPAPFAPAPEFDFRPGVPDLTRFPFDTWRRLVTQRLRAGQADLMTYGDPQGHASLRAEIARHVGVSRDVRASAAQVVVTAGAQQTTDLVARVLLRHGDLAAVEDPGYPPPRLVLTARGVRVAPVPVDESGIVVECDPGGDAAGVRDAVAPVPAGAVDVAGAAARAAGLGRAERRRDRRGRLRHRVPLHRAAAGTVAQPGFPGPGGVRRLVLEGAFPGAAARVPRRAAVAGAGAGEGPVPDRLARAERRAGGARGVHGRRRFRPARPADAEGLPRAARAAVGFARSRLRGRPDAVAVDGGPAPERGFGRRSRARS